MTFIFDGEAQPHDALTVLDNKLKVYQRIRYEVNLDNKKYIHVNCMYTCTELQIRKGNRGNLGSQCMFSLRNKKAYFKFQNYSQNTTLS